MDECLSTLPFSDSIKGTKEDSGGSDPNPAHPALRIYSGTLCCDFRHCPCNYCHHHQPHELHPRGPDVSHCTPQVTTIYILVSLQSAENSRSSMAFAPGFYSLKEKGLCCSLKLAKNFTASSTIICHVIVMPIYTWCYEMLEMMLWSLTHDEDWCGRSWENNSF